MTEHDIDQILSQLRELREKRGSDRIWDIATKLLVPIVLALGVWLIGIQVRVSVIEQSRFSERDGQAMERRIMQALTPEWLRDDLKEIKDRLKRLEERPR